VTSAPTVKKVKLPFTEEEMSLIDDAAKLKNTRSWKGREFTREEDYVLFKFWNKKPQAELGKLMHTSHHILKPRYAHLMGMDNQEYVISLIQEFEIDKEKT
jgi:hypothetical protein